MVLRGDSFFSYGNSCVFSTVVAVDDNFSFSNADPCIISRAKVFFTVLTESSLLLFAEA